MKNQTLKKLFAVVLATVMAATVLTGCGNSAEESKTSEAQSSEEASSTAQSSETQTSEAQSSEAAPEDTFDHDPVLNELGTIPVCNEKVTITIGLPQNANVEDYDTNYYTLKLEEEANVDIEFILFPAGNDGKEKLRMMLTSGEKLPDIIMFGVTGSEAMNWGAEGYILPLEEYFENSSYYAKAGFDRVKESGGMDILGYMTELDGHIWSFPGYFESNTNPALDRMWVYGPWLEKLNIEPPTTRDEFRAMLEAFKTQDPNGNGKADEIPLLGAKLEEKSVFSWGWEYVMNTFTHSTGAKNWLVSEDGQLSFSFMKDEWKEGIKYISELVADGLYDPVSFTQDQATFKSVVNTTGDVLVGAYASNSTSFMPADHPTKNEWILLDPISGPDGFISTAWNPDLPSAKASISTDCEHPEVAFRLLDLMCSDENTITNRWGEKGVNWDYVEEVKKLPEFKDKAFDQTFNGYPVVWVEIKNIWNQPGNTHWMNVGPCFRTAEVAASWYAANLNGTGDANDQMAMHLANYEAVKPAEVISKMRFETEADQMEAEEIIVEIRTYVFQKMAHWFTGQGDVEAEWDTYLTELDAIGANRYLELAQKKWNP